MTYEKQEWNCGDTITADKMNHIEDGIEAASSGGGNLFVKYDHSETVGDDTTYYFDKTWQEVHDALVAGKAVTANVIATVIDDVPSVAEGVLDYITQAYVDTNSKYSIASVLTADANNGLLQFDVLDSPNDYLRISNNK